MTSFEKAQFVVGLGAQKAGTTWLYDYFKNHPEFCINHMKELHYFDVRYDPLFSYDDYEKEMICGFRDIYRIDPDVFFRLCMSNDESCYEEYFRYIHKGEKAFGEITPNYAALNAPVFSKIQSIRPNAKFIFIMRNPIDRLWAQIRFYAQIYRQNIDELCQQIDQPVFRLKSDYIRTIRELHKSTDPSQVLLLFYEELFSDAAVRKICDFCGISFVPGAYDTISNKGRVIRTLDRVRRKQFAEHLYDVYASINDFFDGNIPESWKADMKLMDDVIPKPPQADFEYTCNQNPSGSYKKKLSENVDPVDFEKVFTLKESNSLCHYYRSQLHLRDGAIDASLKSLQEAIRLAPHVPHYYFLLSKLYLKQSNCADALRQYSYGLLKLTKSPRYIVDRIWTDIYRNLPRAFRNQYACTKKRKLRL